MSRKFKPQPYYTNKFKEPVIKVDLDNQVRCPYPNCNHQFFKGRFEAIQIKCPKCKRMIVMEQL